MRSENFKAGVVKSGRDKARLQLSKHVRKVQSLEIKKLQSCLPGKENAKLGCQIRKNCNAWLLG